MIELVSPEFDDTSGNILHLRLHRAAASALGVGPCDCHAAPEACARYALAASSGHDRMTAAGLGIACVVIGFLVAVRQRARICRPSRSARPIILTRWGYALLPLALAITFSGAVLGLWQPEAARRITRSSATSRVSSAWPTTGPPPPVRCGILCARRVRRGGGALRAIRQAQGPYAAPAVSPLLLAAELIRSLSPASWRGSRSPSFSI